MLYAQQHSPLWRYHQTLESYFCRSTTHSYIHTWYVILHFSVISRCGHVIIGNVNLWTIYEMKEHVSWYRILEKEFQVVLNSNLIHRAERLRKLRCQKLPYLDLLLTLLCLQGQLLFFYLFYFTWDDEEIPNSTQANFKGFLVAYWLKRWTTESKDP